MTTRALLFAFLGALAVSSLPAQDGSLDLSFDPGNGANHGVFTVLPQPDGKVVVGGWFDHFNGTDHDFLVRLNEDGGVDNGFGTGTGQNGLTSASALLPDGRIAIGGDFNTYGGEVHNHIARLNTDGSPDPGFAGWVSSLVNSMAVQPDGKLVLVGFFSGAAFSYITRLNTDGSVDTGFDPGTGPNDIVLSTSLQSDGKVIIGGSFTSFNGTPCGCIARLNPDGTLDAGFDTGAGADANVRSITLQPDGGIIIAGSFTHYNGFALNGFARLNADGTLDPGFQSGIEAFVVNCAVVQPDGRIIIGGTFTSYDGVPRDRIARLNTDGTLDLSFDPGSGANGGVESVALQPDGKIIIGGQFTNYDGVARNRIARLRNDFSSAIPIAEDRVVQVFPNPSNGTFVLAYQLIGPTVLTVTDIAGTVVLREQGGLSNGRANILDLGAMASGIYLVTIKSQEATATVRIIKQ